MKKMTPTSAKFCLFVPMVMAIALFSSCQKPSNNKDIKVNLPGDSAEQAKATESIPTAICSDEILGLAKKVKATEAQTNTIYEKMTNEKHAGLVTDYKKGATDQVQLCGSLVKQFEIEKIVACLKNGSEKSTENSIYKKVIVSKCESLAQWEKDLDKKGFSKEGVIPKVIILKFSVDGQRLVQTKDAPEFLYLSKQQVQSGRENMLVEVEKGTQACRIVAQNQAQTESLAFKFVVETTGVTTSLGMELKAKSTTILLQDGKNTMLSLVCFNTTVSAESQRSKNLTQLFGSLATIEEVERDTANLNPDVAPKAPVKVDDKSKAAAQADKDKAMEETIQKARDTINTIVKDTLAEAQKTAAATVKESLLEAEKTSAAIVSKSVAEAQGAASTIVKEAIGEGQKAASAIVKEAVGEAKDAAKEVMTESLVQAEAVADRVVQKSVTEVKTATQEVAKESIAQAQVAADAVVEKGITKAKTAVKETVFEVLNPVTWVKKAYNGIAGFFTSEDEKTVEIKQTDKSK